MEKQYVKIKKKIVADLLELSKKHATLELFKDTLFVIATELDVADMEITIKELEDFENKDTVMQYIT